MMTNFHSFESEIQRLIDSVLKTPRVHGLWLNTLSYLENCGARKIASCEHPSQVKEEMLKHAAEEFRHAFYLKKQLARLDQHYEDYRRSFLLGGWAAYHYLNALDLYVSQYLHHLRLDYSIIKQLSYYLVTYAIELRAGELYPIYQTALKGFCSKVQVQSIILEEKDHLQEMENALRRTEDASIYVERVCKIEAGLFERWIGCCFQEISSHDFIFS